MTKVQATPRTISDELINDLARSSLAPKGDVRAIADWSGIIIKDKHFQKRNDQVQPDTIKPELLKMMIQALMLERRRISHLVTFASSGAMSVDPPSAKRARSSGAMSVDCPAHASTKQMKTEKRWAIL